MEFANRARTYDPNVDEVLHHDLFVALLDALVTRQGGSYADLARRSGLSWRYLKYIRDKQRPIPPAETLERIIGALPDATAREVRALGEFARRALSRSDPPGTVRLVLDPTEVVAELRRLLDANHLAVHAGIAEPGRPQFADVLTGAIRTLARVRDLLGDPDTSAHLGILLCNVLNMIDDPAEALKAARIARIVLEEQAERMGVTSPRLDALWVESGRAEAMSLHNLGDDDAALSTYDRVEQRLVHRPRDPQRTYIALSRISALIGTRGFRIGEVKALVDEVSRASDEGRFSELETPLLLHQARRGLVTAYIRHGDLKPRTERMLRDELDRLDTVAFAGPIHRVQLYRTAADFSAARGDSRGREEFLTAGLSIAQGAGLDHQARKLQKELTRPGERLHRADRWSP